MKYYTIGFGRTIASQKHGLSVPQLSYELRKNKIKSHNYNKAKTPKEIEIIKLQRLMGKTYKELATQYGMSISSMRRYCQ